MAGHGWKLLKWLKMTVTAENGQRQIKITWNGWNDQKRKEVIGNGLNGWRCLEMLEMAGNCYNG